MDDNYLAGLAGKGVKITVMQQNPAPQPKPPYSRRRLLGGVAAAATVAGVGFARWHAGTAPEPRAPNLGQPSAAQDFWQLQMPTPTGSSLALASLQGRPLLVNFWATWCPPCVAELPLINAFYLKNKAKSWQVLGIAVDKLEPVQAFLAKVPLQFPVVLAGMQGVEMSRQWGNLAGGLPFSLVLGSNGAVVQRKMGQLAESDLAAWAGLFKP